jgi:hypothetical protein
VYNVYCDESCHLEKDPHHVMVLGAVWCPLDRSREIAARVREIKVEHGLKPWVEVKWQRVSASQDKLYLALIEYFLDERDLRFRGIVIPNKRLLRHEDFDQDHDTWYYKMYFVLLKPIVDRGAAFRIYLDIKDTRSANKVRHLHEVLCGSLNDKQREAVERIQSVRSHEVEQLQLADLLIGAVGYANRGLEANPAKVAIVERLRERIGRELTASTARDEEKFNVLRWEAKQKGSDVGNP